MLSFLPTRVCDQLDNLKYGLVDSAGELLTKANIAREGTVQNYYLWGRGVPSACLGIHFRLLPPDKGTDIVALCAYVRFKDINRKHYAHCVDIPYKELFLTTGPGEVKFDIATYLLSVEEYLDSEEFLKELQTWKIREYEK